MKINEELNVQPQINKLIELCGGKTEEIKTIVNEIVDKANSGKVEPMEFCVPLGDVKGRLSDESYEIVEYQNGFEYNVKGGFRMFVNPKCLSLYGAIKFMYEILKGDLKPDDKEQEDAFMNFTQAMSFVIQAPITASADTSLMLKVATTIIKHITKMQDIAFDGVLKADDNPELTQAMNDATIAANHIADELKKESEKMNK